MKNLVFIMFILLSSILYTGCEKGNDIVNVISKEVVSYKTYNYKYSISVRIVGTYMRYIKNTPTLIVYDQWTVTNIKTILLIIQKDYQLRRMN